jgi:hypothetical protein
LNRDVFGTAVRNLRTEFAFVGHQESSADAYAQLRRRYGWNAAEGIGMVNTGFRASEAASDSSLSAIIRRFNQWDFLFYQEILRHFPR